MPYVILGTAIPWLLVAIGAWLLFELSRLCGRILLRLDALEGRLEAIANQPAPAANPSAPQPAPPPPRLPMGSPAPAFELPDLAGKRHSLAQFQGRKLLLIFFNPKCGFCTRMGDALAKVAPEGSGDLPMPLVVSTGSVEDNRAMVEQFGLKCKLLVQPPNEVSSRYHANGTPMGYLIDTAGNIASPLAAGADALLALAAGKPLPAPQAAPAPPPDLPLGSPAPAFELADLDGNRRSLASFLGRRVLVIFFSPQCGFCTRMAEALANVSVEDGAGHVLPLLVSAGSAEDNRSMVAEYGLRCPLLLQQQSDISAQYRCPGTPMGYLVDEEGCIASPKTGGADGLLALCRPEATPAPASAPESPAAGSQGAASSHGSDEPCEKGKDGKKPCARCADKAPATNGHALVPVAQAESYDLVELTALKSTDEMAAELERRADSSVRLVILHGAGALNGEAAAALRRFLRRRPEWVVSYQPETANRFLVLSRDPRDRKALPPLFTKAANFAKALSLHIADGASKVTAEQMERRLEVCTLCDRRTGDHCSACGCDLPTKAGWKTTLCPLGKWPALAESQAAAAPHP